MPGAPCTIHQSLDHPCLCYYNPGKDKWHLLQDLRKVNEVVKAMGPLQPGLPSPSMLPRDLQLTILDIKDCFLNIPLYPGDVPRFAFSVPSVSHGERFKRYHWVTLPQGMKNSPVLYQTFVTQVLSPVCKMLLEAIILHYMDNVLNLDSALSNTVAAIENRISDS